MKILLIGFAIVILCGCAGPKLVRMDPDKEYIMEHEGKPIFSLRVPESGEWYLGAMGTMKRGVINIDGSPDNSYVGYALRFIMETGNNHPKFLNSVIPVLKTGDYQQFLRDSLDWYTPERLLEQKKDNPGGRVMDIRGLRCKNFWVSEHIGPALDNPRYGGQGIITNTNYIVCPLVIDGSITQFGVVIRSSISDQIYKLKEEYDRTKNPEDPEFIIDPVPIMQELGESVVEMFGSLKIFGNISQDYEDVTVKCHPTLGDKC